MAAPNSERERVLDLLRRHGWNSTSFQVLEQGFSYWFDPEGDGSVAYVDTGRAWVAAGAPIAREEDLGAAAQRFERAAARAGRRACFFAVEERMIRAADLRAMPIGEQPSWSPERWPSVVASSRNLREQLRRARAKGVVVREATATEIADPASPLRARVDALIDSWLASRKMAPMGFLVNVEPFAFPEERLYLVAEQGGELMGILVAVPVFTRRGLLFEDLLRSPRAPNGTVELLVDAGMQRAAARGLAYVTLGLAPLAGALPRWLRIVRAL
ncbi:MAG: DUF2156 domain-containing protein, partial [Myxococcales bacterium]|nr:DUF2156 domain-containing protein [Myxococcales bacterium]